MIGVRNDMVFPGNRVQSLDGKRLCVEGSNRSKWSRHTTEIGKFVYVHVIHINFLAVAILNVLSQIIDHHLQFTRLHYHGRQHTGRIL